MTPRRLKALGLTAKLPLDKLCKILALVVQKLASTLPNMRLGACDPAGAGR